MIVCLLLPVPVLAQPTPDAWDGAFVAGAFFNRPQPRVIDNTGYHTPLAALVIGHYWSTHLKTELEATVTGEGRRYMHRTTQDPAFFPVTVYSTQDLRVRQASAAIVWQFFENQWVHPFVVGGLVVDVERSRIVTPEQFYYRGDPRLPDVRVQIAGPSVEGPETTTRLKGLIGVGTKLYVSPRAFIRLDARTGIGAGDWHLALRGGVGIDF